MNGRAVASRLAAVLNWSRRFTLCSLGAAGTCLGQTPLQGGEPPQVQLQGEVELARLVDLCAQRLGVGIEYDAAVLKGKATLRVSESLSDQQLWHLTNRVLGLRGFTSVLLPGDDGDRMLSVVRLTDAPGLVTVSSSPSAEDGLAGFIAVVVRVDHQPVSLVSDALRAVLSRGSGSLTPLGTGNLLLIADLRPRVEQALELLRQIDQPREASLIDRIELKHVTATQLAAFLSSIAAARDLVEGGTKSGRVMPEPGNRAVVLIAPPNEAQVWRELITRFDRRPPVETRTYTPRYFGVDEVATLVEQVVNPAGSQDAQWRLVRDQLTGSIVLTASPLQHEEVDALIARLDSASGEVRRPMRTYQVRNRPVADVMSVLDRLRGAGVFEATEGDSRAERDTAPGDERGAPLGISSELQRSADRASGESRTNPLRESQGFREGMTLSLTTDEATNTIIAIGEQRLLDQVARLIDELDVRQPQVMVEILIVSLSESQTLDLGVELEKIAMSGDVKIALSSLFGLSTVLDGVRSVGNARGGSALVLSPGDFSVVVRALQTVNDGRSLNVPRVLVNNNQEASLNSVLQQPFVSINAFDTIATTSFGGTQDAGTVVTVKPQIAAGDHMIVDYSVTLSAFVGESTDPSLPPPRQENRLQSVATIPDGFVVALGGIEVASQSKGVSQVPGLGGIPIVGELFRNRSRSESRSRFYIFIRPSILRRLDFEDLRYLSEAPAESGGIDDGWPRVEPRVIR